MSDDIVYRVVAAVADAEGVTPTELDAQVNAAVDPEALTALAESDSDAWTLTFELAGHHVTVDGTGLVAVDGAVVEPPDAGAGQGTDIDATDPRPGLSDGE